MKKFTLIRLIALAFIGLLIISGCKSSKDATGGPEDDPNRVTIYCSGPEYRTNAEYMRANSSGTSSDMEMARDKAMTNARARLSAQIETFISNLTDFYKKDTRINENEIMEERFEQLIREVFKNKLNGTYPICEEMVQKDGKYVAYVAVELGGEEMLDNAASQISADEELKVDYDYEKFKKSYEEAMKDLKEDRGN